MRRTIFGAGADGADCSLFKNGSRSVVTETGIIKPLNRASFPSPVIITIGFGNVNAKN